MGPRRVCGGRRAHKHIPHPPRTTPVPSVPRRGPAGGQHPVPRPIPPVPAAPKRNPAGEQQPGSARRSWSTPRGACLCRWTSRTRGARVASSRRDRLAAHTSHAKDRHRLTRTQQAACWRLAVRKTTPPFVAANANTSASASRARCLHCPPADVSQATARAPAANACSPRRFPCPRCQDPESTSPERGRQKSLCRPNLPLRWPSCE